MKYRRRGTFRPAPANSHTSENKTSDPCRTASRSYVRHRYEPPCLFLRADLQPIFEQDDTGIDDNLLKRGHHFQEMFGLLFGAEAHDPLNAGPVVPAAVEDHDLPGRGKMRDVALGVHLRLFALGGRGQRHDAVIALIVPPLPAPSRPSKRMHTFTPLCTTHCWSLTNSTCSRASWRSYSFRFSLPSAIASPFFSSGIGS